ncbi:MAG: hypothetical protein LBM61_01135 [Prevotellaceae bacterium]|jgi:hypothetical protein|nr:hypothetical protein [Prevotellaceae bacterium]
MKQHLFWGGLCLLGLLAACTQIEQPPTGGEVGDLVTLTVQREEDPVTRAEPVVPDGYKLRYILEIRDKAASTPRPTQRFEQDNGSFAFMLAEGTYDFLLWSDYIAEDAELSKAKYPDKYYNTQNLKEVFRTNAMPDSLAEHEAMDAFFGVLPGVVKGASVLPLTSVTLTRPFARINLVQEPLSMLATVRAVGLSYTKAKQTFDIQTGEVETGDTEEKTLVLTNNGEVFQMADKGIFAYAYLFAPEEGNATTASVIDVSFYSNEAATQQIGQTCEIPAGKSYKRNYVTNVRGDYLDADGELDIDHGLDYEEYVDPTLWDGVYPDVQYPDDPTAGAIATLGDPISPGVYEITTADQLDCMAWLINNAATNATYRGYTYNLKVDIDLDGESADPEKLWTPIGTYSLPFTGTLNGGGHLIKNMNVNGEYQCAGFFGVIDGGAASYLQVSGSVTSTTFYSNVGGIAGYLYDGTISFCSYEGSLSPADAAGTGGIVGFMYADTSDSSLQNCVSLLTSVTNPNASNNGTILGYSGAGDYHNYITNCAWTPCDNTATTDVPDDKLTIGKTSADQVISDNTEEYATVTAMFADSADNAGINANASAFRWFNDDGTLTLKAVDL